MLREIFKSLDINDSGTINLKEVSTHLHILTNLGINEWYLIIYDIFRLG